jgi:HPt (histidine-containing phosphotransfer) domain-containing protein
MSIDRKVIIASMSEDPETICECVAEFAPSARADLTAITMAVAARNAKSVQQASHSLKGSAALLGAYELQRRCDELERSAEGCDWTLIQALASKVAPVLMEVEQALDTFVKQLRVA